MSLVSLSNEVLLDCIFTYLEIQDLYRLMHSCSRFNVLLSDANKLWKKKFKERWPQISFCEQLEGEVNWLERTNLRLRIKRVVKEEVRSMSTLCYPESPEKYTPENVVNTLTTGDYPYLEFIDDELTQLKFNPSKELANDLTFGYYVNHLYTKIRICLLEKKWLKFMAIPEAHKSLFEGALILSDWINMDFREDSGSSGSELMLDWIVDRVKFLLGETPNYSSHGAVVQSTETEILTAISRVFFQEKEMKLLNLHVDDDEIEERNNFVACYCFCPATYSADVVLVSDARIGHNIILCVLYQEVAKRMGILCEPIFCYKEDRSYKRVVLRWKEHPQQEDGYAYIDMYKKGSLERIDAGRRLGPIEDDDDDEVFYDVDINPAVATAEQLFQEMIRLLLDLEDRRGCGLSHGYTKPYWVYPTSSLCRLACAISPSSTELARAYATLCERNLIQFDDSIRLCQALRIPCVHLHTLLNEHRRKLAECVIINRSPSVKYAVGLVMVYKDNARGYMIKNLCVITSWDNKCKDRCNYGKKSVVNLDQPFYNILLDEGTSKYVPEDQLELHRNPAITRVRNWDLGLHFEKFDGCIFVPNVMSKSRFPDDEDFARALVNGLVNVYPPATGV